MARQTKYPSEFKEEAVRSRQLVGTLHRRGRWITRDEQSHTLVLGERRIARLKSVTARSKRTER